MDKHLTTVLPFLAERMPDVTCVQEVIERDIPLFEKVCGPCVSFAPQCLLERDGGLVREGVALFSKLPAKHIALVYYVGSEDTIRLDTGSSDVGTHAFIAADIGEEAYRIITLHFTWTPGGVSTREQLENLDTLFSKLEGLGPFVLVGDFNAPRGNETFSRIATRYKDSIPEHYKTSIDLALHKTRDNPIENARVGTYMVDGLFTTPAYSAKDVELQFGVSDHAAIVATIEKTA